MTDITYRPRTERPGGEENLAQLLRRLARRTSDGGLAAAAGAGLVGAIASLLWAGRGWTVSCALALCFVAFGAWGISDRELNERLSGSHTRGLNTLRVTRWLARTLGVMCGLAALFAALALALGTWIS